MSAESEKKQMLLFHTLCCVCVCVCARACACVADSLREGGCVYVAVCCGVLQCMLLCDAVYCSVSQRLVAKLDAYMLQCVAVCCSGLQCTAECCSVL